MKNNYSIIILAAGMSSRMKKSLGDVSLDPKIQKVAQSDHKSLIPVTQDNDSLMSLLLQNILQTCIQNTPIEMQNQIQRALQAGALGAKTVGSGGGGCIVALANQKTKNKVIRAFLGAGSKKAYPIEIV